MAQISKVPVGSQGMLSIKVCQKVSNEQKIPVNSAMQQGPRHNVNDLVSESDLHFTSHEPHFQYEELSPKLLCFQFHVWHSKLLCLNFQIQNCYSKISKLAIHAGVHICVNLRFKS